MNRLLVTLMVLVFALELWAIPAFPGAEGYGAVATGGRGGRVMIVTNTNSTGAGSLRAALSATGPRIIVFRTSGVIDLGVQYARLTSVNADFTLAGQTSPGGVTLVSSLQNLSQSIMMCYNPCGIHDFVIRHIRFRGGVDNMDAFTFTGAHSFILDHCDFSGGNW